VLSTAIDQPDFVPRFAEATAHCTTERARTQDGYLQFALLSLAVLRVARMLMLRQN
jgi:hypothetical protein